MLRLRLTPARRSGRDPAQVPWIGLGPQGDLPDAPGSLRKVPLSQLGDFVRIVVFGGQLSLPPGSKAGRARLHLRDARGGIWNEIPATASVTEKGHFGILLRNLLLLDIVAARFSRLPQVSAR